MNLIYNMCLGTSLLKFLPHVLGANELRLIFVDTTIYDGERSINVVTGPKESTLPQQHCLIAPGEIGHIRQYIVDNSLFFPGLLLAVIDLFPKFTC